MSDLNDKEDGTVKIMKLAVERGESEPVTGKERQVSEVGDMVTLTTLLVERRTETVLTLH